MGVDLVGENRDFSTNWAGWRYIFKLAIENGGKYEDSPYGRYEGCAVTRTRRGVGAWPAAASSMMWR